jgi:prepilin-type N-terminal cleavage/methylation domain-containing protein
MSSEMGSPRGEYTRAGFSMVEIIVAIVVLAVGVLGLAGTTAFLIRNVTYADLMTERAAAFQTIVDRIQSLPFDSVGSGSDSVGIFRVTWSSTLSGPQNKIVQIITTGPGVGVTNFPTNQPMRVDTFQFRVLRR